MERARAIGQLAAIRNLQDAGAWIQAANAPGFPTKIEHPRIFFPSYPYEWCADMLYEAAELTLKANLALLDEGWELKDAAASNVLFSGPNPVFVDFLSPVQRGNGQMGWSAYGQFARNFLIPLMLVKHHQIPLAWMGLAERDGVAPEDALGLLGFWGRLRPAEFSLVTLPCVIGRMSRKTWADGVGRSNSAEVGLVVTRRLLDGLRKRLSHLAPVRAKASRWTEYQDSGQSYSAKALEVKEGFVLSVIQALRPATMLDLGCNTGKFSILGAQAGARCIALDSDPECVGRVFHFARKEGLDIQPLIQNLERPSPKLGWGQREAFSLVDRIGGGFDLTLALAVVHHLLVRGRVPLGEIIAFIAEATKRVALIEWVPPSDIQFKRLAGSNLGLYDAVGLEEFKSAIGRHFLIEESRVLPDSERVLIMARKRGNN